VSLSNRLRGLALSLALLSPPASAAEILPPLSAPPAQEPATLEWRAFRTFTSADGLPQNSVLALLQDADGFVYAGTNHGAARYDGRRWQEVPLPTGGRNYAVGALAQTRDGARWFGTDAVGAWRVAGGKAERAALPGSDGGVNAFWESADGRMWIAAYDGLFRCRALKCERVEALGEAGARSLLGEMVDGRGRLWVGTNLEGAVELDGLDLPTPRRTGRHLGRQQGLPNDVGLSLARFEGDLWIGCGRGLARFDGRRLHVYGRDNGFPNAMVFALQPSTRLDGTPVLLAALRPGGLAEIARDGSWRVIDSQRGLPSNAVHSLLRERGRGTLWIGTMTAGVARAERDRWALFDERMGLPDRLVLGVGWLPRTQQLWAGTAGGAARWGGSRFVPLLPGAQAPQLVYDVLDAPDGTRWVAHARGLQRWRGEVLELDYSLDASALPAVSTDRLALRRGGRGFELFAASGHGMARWTQAGGLQRVDDLPGIEPGTAIRAFATRSDGAQDVLWAATGAGLVRRDDSGWQAVQAPCLDGNDVFGLALEAAPAPETAWLATRGGLYSRRPDGNCTAWPAARVLGALTQVRVDGEEVWVFGARGVLHLRRGGDPTQAGHFYGTEAGLVSPEIAMSAIDARGRVFGATAAGLAALDPADASTNRAAAREPSDAAPTRSASREAVDAAATPASSGLTATKTPQVSAPPGGTAPNAPQGSASPKTATPTVMSASAATIAAAVDATSLAPLRWLQAVRGTARRPLTANTVLPHDDSSTRFEWSLLAFDREYAVRYRWRLQGLDADFTPWSTQNTVTYPRLPPGHYVLRVEARDADGVAAAPLTLAFAVDSPWWLRPWAIAAGALLLVAVGLGLGRLRWRAARRRAQVLETEVAARTRELAAANARLEQAAVTDPLTGLKNRRYFALAAAEEAERALRGPAHQALLVVLLDVDHFKRINDRHGHAAGDAVLGETAARLQCEARGGDIVLRWGGEEFLLLLRDVERDAVPSLLRRLLEALARDPMHGLAVTTSLGAVGFPLDGERTTLEHAIAQADTALYRAKREGRDRGMLRLDGERYAPIVRGG
jgi:diguanylate cyclase (GGDEF)-like protein